MVLPYLSALNTIRHADFAKQVINVGFHCVHADVQYFSHLGVSSTRRGDTQNLLLPFGENSGKACRITRTLTYRCRGELPPLT